MDNQLYDIVVVILYLFERPLNIFMVNINLQNLYLKCTILIVPILSISYINLLVELDGEISVYTENCSGGAETIPETWNNEKQLSVLTSFVLSVFEECRNAKFADNFWVTGQASDSCSTKKKKIDGVLRRKFKR